MAPYNYRKRTQAPNSEALIGVFGSKGAWPKKGREQGSMNEKFGSLGAHEFFLGNHFEDFMPFS